MDTSQKLKLSELIQICDSDDSDNSNTGIDNVHKTQNYINKKLICTNKIKSEIIEGDHDNNDNEASKATIYLDEVEADEILEIGVLEVIEKFESSRQRINKLERKKDNERALKITTKTNVIQNQSKRNNNCKSTKSITDKKVAVDDENVTTHIKSIDSNLVNVKKTKLKINTKIKTKMKKNISHLIIKRTKNSDPMFECAYCGKSCTYKSNLICHIRSHYVQKPFSCIICKRTFVNSTDLRVHHRMHTGEKPYQCKVCNKYFARTQFLMRHVRVHTGEKPFKCNLCAKRFRVSYQLTVHKRTHSGVKPYKCGICERSFSSSSILRNHRRSHTGEKPYICNICKKSYTRNENLIKHTNKYHSK